jgi:hypothetical protein
MRDLLCLEILQDMGKERFVQCMTIYIAVKCHVLYISPNVELNDVFSSGLYMADTAVVFSRERDRGYRI